MDAQAAVDALLEQRQQADSKCKEQPKVEAQLSKAYMRLGEAYLAEREHPDRDCKKALKVQTLIFQSYRILHENPRLLTSVRQKCPRDPLTSVSV